MAPICLSIFCIGAHAQFDRPNDAHCRVCGVILSIDKRGHVRKLCAACLPAFEAERTANLVRAARQTLAEMRSSRDDPAQTSEAKAKRARSIAKRTQAAREWERANPRPHDRDEFISEIFPLLSGVTLPTMMKATGLTSGYCFKRGERVPHPMYWERLRALVVQNAASVQR